MFGAQQMDSKAAELFFQIDKIDAVVIGIALYRIVIKSNPSFLQFADP